MRKILIINDDPIEAGKLKLVLGRFGACDTAPSGSEGIRMFIKAHQENAPYRLISLEAEMKSMRGLELIESLRKYEVQKGIENRSFIMVEISEDLFEELEDELERFGVKSLFKPYNRKTLQKLLNDLGLQEESKPAPPPTQAAPAKTQEEEEERIRAALSKISRLVSNPEAFQGIAARQMLEELVKQGGKQAELLMGQLINSPKLSIPSRIEVILSASYIRSPLFLVPLNRVIDTETNIKLVEVALVSISKFSDQRALNILHNALKKIKNPMLLNTIRREIAKIKKDRPVLSILPRYLNSYKSAKNFRVTLDILKNILSPDDQGLFINYLKSGNPVLEDGTFELLCYAGDTTLKKILFDYFNLRIGKIECMAETDCYDLYITISHLQKYLKRYPELIDEQISRLKTLFGNTNDIRAKQIIVSIFSICHQPEALEFLRFVYQQEEKLRAPIIEDLAGNPTADEFLFEKYESEEEIRGLLGKTIISLLKSQKGLKYFVDNFFDLDTDKQELILRNFVFTHEPYLYDFIYKVFDSQLYNSKVLLMKIIRDNFLYRFKDMLFEKNNEREFTFMGKEYFQTIMQVFPFTSLKSFFDKIAHGEISTNKVKKYLEMIKEVSLIEPVVNFSDTKFVNALFGRIYKSNNAELNAKFFNSFENIKTLNLPTYKYLLDAANAFQQARGAIISDNEKGAITKLKQKLMDQFPEIRDIEQFPRELKIVFVNKPINLEQLEKLLRTSHKAVAQDVERICLFLASKLKNNAYISPEERETFNVRFPMIGKFVDFLWSQGLDTLPTEEWSEIPRHGTLLKHFQDEMRIIIAFKERELLALFKDQMEDAIPQFQLLQSEKELQPTDILICDSPSLKEYVKRKQIGKQRIYLCLESRADYTAFQDFHPKAFMKPISLYRVIKLILSELYMPK